VKVINYFGNWFNGEEVICHADTSQIELSPEFKGANEQIKEAIKK
jgi:hypothetical protein